jgi:hypothetical protein
MNVGGRHAEPDPRSADGMRGPCILNDKASVHSRGGLLSYDAAHSQWEKYCAAAAPVPILVTGLDGGAGAVAVAHVPLAGGVLSGLLTPLGV